MEASSSWQTELSTVRERNLYAFNNSLFFDVEFSVVDSNGDKVILQAHKYVLAISSPVFEAMFYGELAETGRTIDLPDCTKEGLQQLLHYVYSDQINVTASNVMQLLYLAKKYMLPFVEEKCREYLDKELKPQDVFVVLPQVKQLGDEKLEEHCWDVVDSQTKRAVLSDAFLDVPHEVLCQFLGRDSLKIKEVDLFQAVDKWALKRIEEKGLENNGENKRAILGEEAIRLIRFPLMSQKEFAKMVLPCKVLTMDEVIELSQLFNSFAPSTKMFNAKKRSASVFSSRIRFGSVSASGWGYGYCPDAVNFTVNNACFLVGVRLFGSPGNSYDVDLSIYKNEEVVSQISSRFPTEDKMIDDQYYGFTVTLDKPVPLDRGVRYTIAAKIRGRTSYRGNDGQTSVECEDLVIEYLKSDSRSQNSTSATSGQFPSLVFVCID